jgi:hypothetical protein
MAMASVDSGSSCRVWFWPQALVLAKGLVLATGCGSGCRVWFWLQGVVLAAGCGSGCRVWFWLQSVVLAADFNFVDNSFF